MDTDGLFSIRGKVALVTGGSRGIGEMIARGYVAAGAKVYISSRNREACDALAAELSATGECISVPSDLSTPEGCTALADRIAEAEPELHILVNNAGAAWEASLEEHPVHGFDKVMNLNVRAVFLLTQALVPLLRRAGTPDDPARVINIGSIDGLHVSALPVFGYTASKAAVHQLSRHLGRVLAPDHVTVNAIAPGYFPSRMTKNIFENNPEKLEGIPMGRPGAAEDIAGMSIFLASRAGAYVTGAVIPVDGGYSTLL